MRHLIFFVSLIIITSTLANAQSKDKQRNGLVGHVRSIHEETARLENKSGRMEEGPRIPIHHLIFDKEGNVIEQSANNPDGSFKSKLAWALSYDRDGRETEKNYYNAAGALTSRGISTYDDSGRKSRLTHFNPNGSINHYQLYIYNGRGNKIEEIHFNPNDSLRSRILYRYDEKDRQTEVIYHKPDGIVTQRNIFTYDENGNMSGLTMFDGTESVKIRLTYKYDSRGNLIEGVNQGSNNWSVIKGTYKYEFDSIGNWVKREITREVTKAGKIQIENEVTYRAIAYY